MKKSNITLKYKYKLIIVEWEDSTIGYQGWKYIIKQPRKLPRFISVGFLTYEDKNCIILYPHIENINNEKERMGTGDMKIPKSAIRKRKVLI